MKVSNVLAAVLALFVAAASSSCGSLSRPITEREQSAGIGALAGGAGGAIIGSFAGSAVAGGLVGMPIGALAGYYIGDQLQRREETQQGMMDDRDREIERLRKENERLRQQQLER